MKIIIKSASGISYELSSRKPVISIGRSLKCDLVVKDESLSRQHAIIENKEDGLFILDNGSANGVFVDGKRIQPHTRTPINTFLQVSLSSLTCEISLDDEGEFSPDDLDIPPLSGGSATLTKTKLKIDSGSKPAVKISNKEDRAHRGFIISVIFSLLIIALGIYHSVTKEDLPTSRGPQTTTISNVPEHLKTLPDRFLSPEEYRNLANASCEGFKRLCEEMRLEASKGEGAILKENELFIFMLPSLKYDYPGHSSIQKAQDKDDLVALYWLLQTESFEDFQNKKIGQIHLVLKSREGRPTRVLRFHAKNYALQGPERLMLASSLLSGISSGEFKDFRNLAKPLIETQDL